MAQPHTTEIARDQWPVYLDRLAALQKDRPVQIEVVGPDLGDQPLVRHAQLRTIGASRKGESAGTIEVDLGVEEGGLDHRILHPSHLYAIEEDRGLSCLEIEDDDRNKTLIRFEKPEPLRA